MSKKTIFSIVAIAIFSLTTFGLQAQETTDRQTVTVSGVVIDDVFNEPIPGARIFIQTDPERAVMTNMQGQFSISATRGEVIVFRMMGLVNYYHTVTDNVSELVIRMEDDREFLEELVIYRGLNRPARQPSSILVRGIVMDDDFNEPLPGARVFIQTDPSRAIMANMHGRFSIPAAIGEVLVFQMMGLENHYHTVTDSGSDLVIRLVECQDMLNEVVLIACPHCLQAQNTNINQTVTISGTVIDCDFNEPLPGARVSIQTDPERAVMTNLMGRFSISAAIGEVVVFRMMGFENHYHTVTGNASGLSIRMIFCQDMLDELIIIGCPPCR